MAGYWEIPERCRSCANKRNEGTSIQANYKCYCLPYWGKEIVNGIECPKDMENGGTLRSIVRVQGMNLFKEE